MVPPSSSSSSSSSPAVAVYCGSSNGKHEAFQAAARSLGSALAKSRRTLVYGGGSKGLMGVVSAAALENGGKVIGIVPRAILAASGGEAEKVDEGDRTSVRLDVNGGVDRRAVQTIPVDSMHERKVEIAKRVTLGTRHHIFSVMGFVALPGGFGTFEEVLEVITWTQVGLHDKSVVLLNVNGFWDPLRALIKQSIQMGFVNPASERLAIFVDGPSPSANSSSSSSPNLEAEDQRSFDEFDWGKAALEALDSWERGLVKPLYDWPDRMDRT